MQRQKRKENWGNLLKLYKQLKKADGQLCNERRKNGINNCGES